METRDTSLDVAIVGISGRFPGALSLAQFWSNLASGTVSTSRFSRSELVEAGVAAELLDEPGFVPCAPVLDNAARFDARFFGYSPREAQFIDPQQRQLLEVAWGAFENAGYDPERIDDAVGVFAGTAINTYMLGTGLGRLFYKEYLPVLLGSDKDYTATRIAFKLGLTGPALTVQTACSTSLVALHTACQSLLNEECRMALVGAATVRTPLATGHIAEAGSVFSPDGVCRPFDAGANGTIFGSGACAVLVKRYDDAVEDQDIIHAVVRGTAVNNDGKSKSDFTAPSISKQAEAISEALGAADVDAAEVSLVEAHGTGTFIGDPIEVEALSRAFGADQDSQYCAIGSVKSNIGHLDAASGLASLAKVVLALQHRQIPPTANFSSPNPQIDFENSPFRVANELQAWEASEGSPRIAGITSLGMGGTNAHVVVQEAPPRQRGSRAATDDSVILPLSANSSQALKARCDDLAEFLSNNKDAELADVAYTLQRGRAELPYRAAVTGVSVSDIVTNLKSGEQGFTQSRRSAIAREVVFMFPGQGAQFNGMGVHSYRNEPVFKASFDATASIVEAELGVDIGDLIFNDATSDPDRLNETIYTQPCLFAIELAFARLFESWGVVPTGLIGHSIGEFAAAVIAGVMSSEAAAKVVCKRSSLMQSCERGAMLSVNLPVEKAKELLDERYDIAVINSADSTVIGGSIDDIETLKGQIKASDVKCTILKTSHAFHSKSMQQAADGLADFLQSIDLRKPEIRFISNVTGDWITDQQAVSVDYWASQLRSTVRFADGLGRLMDAGPTLLLELGPRQVLSGLATSHDRYSSSHACVGTEPGDNSLADARLALAECWTHGYATNWDVNGSSGVRISLPTYPFEGDNHWYQAPQQPANPSAVADNAPARVDDSSEWCWGSGWATASVSAAARASDDYVALIAGNVSAQIANLFNSGQGDASVLPTVELENVADADWLAMDAAGSNQLVYHWSSVVSTQQHFDALSKVVSSLARLEGQCRVYLLLVVENSFDFEGDGNIDVAATAAHGFAAGLALEFDHVICKVVDLPLGEKNLPRLTGLIHSREHTDLYAFRAGRWWFPKLQQLDIPPVGAAVPRGTTVILGGLGGVGRVIAKDVAQKGGAVALVTRRALPKREQWSDILKSGDHALHDEIEFLRELAACPGKSEVFCAETTSVESVRSLLGDIAKRLGEPEIVFQLAGAVEDKSILLKSSAEIATVLEPKIQLTQRVYDAIAADFDKVRLVLFSSTAAWAPHPGQIDYASANAFQLAFAESKKMLAGPRVLAIAWPGWIDTGMVARIQSEPALAEIKNRGVTRDEGLDLLWRLIASDQSSAFVSPVDLMSARYQDKQTRFSDSITESASDGVQEAPVDRIKALFSGLLGVDDIEDDDSFFALGGNSLLAVRLSNQLEREFGEPFAVEKLLESGSPIAIAQGLSASATATPAKENVTDIGTTRAVDRLAENATNAQSAATSALLVKLAEGPGDGNPTPLFMVHAQGGLVMLYSSFAKHMQSTRTVYGVKAVGLDGKEEPLRDAASMARRYADAIQEQAGAGPVALGGFCMGGVLAWETAAELQRRNVAVSMLTLIQTFHRSLPYPRFHEGKTVYSDKAAPLDQLSLRVDRVVNRCKPYARHIGSPTRFYQEVAATFRNRKLRKLNSSGDRMLDHVGGDERLLRVHQANEDAFWGLEPRSLDIPVLVLTSKDQPLANRRDMFLGWESLIDNLVATARVSGSYIDGFAQLDGAEIAELMEKYLSER